MIEELKYWYLTNDDTGYSTFDVTMPINTNIKFIRLVQDLINIDMHTEDGSPSYDELIWDLKCLLFVNLDDDEAIEKLDDDIKKHMDDVSSYI